MRRILILSILVLSAGTWAFAECSADDKKALEAFDRAWGAATLGGDRAAMMAIYADDFIGLPGGQSKMAAIDSAMKAFERNKANPAQADKITHEHYRISCTPNSALITHRNTVWAAQGTGGKPEMFYTRSVHSLEKRNGKWVVVGNAGNGIDDYDAIWYLEQDWNDAIAKRDRKWFEANYAADFSSVSSMTANVMDRAADIADTVDAKGKFDSAETSDMDIKMDGNTAIVTGVFRLKGTDENGKAFDHRSRYTDVWIKRDGRWQAWSSQGTMIPDKKP